MVGSTNTQLCSQSHNQMSKPWSWLTTEIYNSFANNQIQTFEKKLTTNNGRVFYLFIESKKAFEDFLLLNFYLVNDPFSIQVKQFNQYFVNSSAELYFVIDTHIYQIWQLDLMNQQILETEYPNSLEITPTDLEQSQSLITPGELQELLNLLD